LHEELERHIGGIAKILSSQYEATGRSSSPTVLGHLREVFVAQLLNSFLPSTNEILKGDITDSTGSRSNQQDVVIYDRKTPKLQLIPGVATLFAEGVKATIEIKSNLTRQKFNEALTNVCSVKSLRPRINPLAVTANPGYIYCYVFAYEGPTDETIIRYYNDFKRNREWNNTEFFNNIPDVIYVLDGSIFYKNDGTIWARIESDTGEPVYYVKSEHPIARNKFFLHIALAVSKPDIYTIDWTRYFE